jgi:hypothetical protein
MLIATEAGGMATGSHSALKKNKENGVYNDIDDEILIGKYLPSLYLISFFFLSELWDSRKEIFGS